MITSLGISWTIFTYCFVYSVFLSVSFTWKWSYQRIICIYCLYYIYLYIYICMICVTHIPNGVLGFHGFHDQRVSMGVEVSHHPSTRYCLLWCSWERGKSSSSTGLGSRGHLAGGGGNSNIFGTGKWFLEKDAPIFELIFFEGVGEKPPTIVFFCL